MKHLVLFSAICVAGHAPAQPLLPASTQGDVSRLTALAAKQPDAHKLTIATKGRYPTAMIHGRCMVGFLGKLQGTGTLADDAHFSWGARVGDIISFRIDAYHLDRLHAITGMSYAELAHTLTPALDKVVRAIRADSVQQGINLPQSYTGRDVLIGVTDWGFDYSHPMFYDTAMTATRIHAAWDQSKQSGPAPAGYTYGTTYSSEAELIAAQSDTVGSWGIRDLHGTHVAGIAGGGGAGTAFRGVAFDAGFLFVSTLLDEAAFFDGFAWMRDQAQQAGKRLVINLSLGNHDGTLDGNSLWSQAIDQITDQGVLFVCGNGNDGGAPFHIRHDFASDTVRTRVQFPGFSDPILYGQHLTLWGEPGASFSTALVVTDNSNAVLVSTPWYSTTAPPSPMDSMLVAGTDTVHFTFASEAAHPLNGRPQMILEVTKPASSKKVALMFTATSGTVHAWNDVQYTNGIAGGGLAFQAAGAGWTAGDDQ